MAGPTPAKRPVKTQHNANLVMTFHSFGGPKKRLPHRLDRLGKASPLAIHATTVGWLIPVREVKPAI